MNLQTIQFKKTILLVASFLLIGFLFLQESNIQNYISEKTGPPLLNDAFQSMSILGSPFGNPLVKSKACDASTIKVHVNPRTKIPVDRSFSMKLLVDGKKYDEDTNLKMYSSTTKSSFIFFEKKILKSTSFEVKTPAFEEFQKEELDIKCEFYADGKLIDSIEETIRYVEDGEEITFKETKGFLGVGGCKSPNYFTNETLYALDKKGNYNLDKDMITYIVKEKDQYKITTFSPAGFLINQEDDSYRIPVPAFPEKISYVDLSHKLIPGTYKNSMRHQWGQYVVDEKTQGKYIAYNYDFSPVGFEKTIVYDECVLIEKESICEQMPGGIQLRFVDYPLDIPNTYTSL